ncbi:hypothetical protein [Capillimicrobium parvum]|uniref:Uncharacterized protein n=1 Tax=Capillimicrobium parvum TaxID=2884022 RepID=A0A9E6XX64_9ACTN|nr:hypothetical protein [Capillimicrobium parvum]UGS36159.1 hypothetical protein DSM104329_02559 [Capillimicrobium parvum]
MSLFSRRTVTTLMATAIAAAVLVVPGAASAKTVKFTMTENGKSSGPPKYLVDGTVAGTLGKGKAHSQTLPPTTKGYWKLKGGTIYYTFNTTLQGTVASGKGKLTRGTGKYKGVKGSFNVRGDITGKFPFQMKGTARY